MSKKKDKPLTMEEFGKLFSVFKDGMKPPPGYKFTRYFDSEEPLKVHVSPVGAGAPKKMSDEELEGLIRQCISQEKIIHEPFGSFPFLTAKDKIKPRTIADYIINVEGKDYNQKWLGEKIKGILSKLDTVHVKGGKFYKKR